MYVQGYLTMYKFILGTNTCMDTDMVLLSCRYPNTFLCNGQNTDTLTFTYYTNLKFWSLDIFTVGNLDVDIVS
jgi:hypothetical protein